MENAKKGMKPVIAILTTDHPKRKFIGNRKTYRDLLKTGESMGIVTYVVTTSQLKLDQSKVNGYVYDSENKTWIQKQMPLPRIIYNRIPLRKDELKPEVQAKLQECMDHPRIRIFNPYFFNKWMLYEWLIKSRSSKLNVPETKNLDGPEDLADMIKKYRLVYLKPVKGKAGMGIMRLEKKMPPGAEIRLVVQQKTGSKATAYTDIASLWSSIAQLTRRDDYILQQGIKLANTSNRPYDLRVLVQKNRSGDWDFTGIGARVAGPASITTHVPRGGSIASPLRLLMQSFGRPAARKLMTRIKHTALLVARHIERQCGHSLGEMSMDLGVDTAGKIWFFEANAKPMEFDEPHIRQKSLRRIYQYGLHLAKR